MHFFSRHERGPFVSQGLLGGGGDDGRSSCINGWGSGVVGGFRRLGVGEGETGAERGTVHGSARVTFDSFVVVLMVITSEKRSGRGHSSEILGSRGGDSGKVLGSSCQVLDGVGAVF